MTDYTLKEAAQLLGLPVETLRTKAKRGKLEVVQVERHGKSERGVTQATFDTLKESNSDYEATLAGYWQEMRTFGLTGRPVGEKYIEEQKYYLAQFWSIIGGHKSIQVFNAGSLKLVYAQYQPDKEARKFYYSTKMWHYKTIRSIATYLFRQKLLSAETLADIAAAKPRRGHTPSRPALALETINADITTNSTWLDGRSEFDQAVMNTLLHLYSFAGLRRMEAAELRPEDLHGNTLRVFGKGNKVRYVPILPQLKEALASWEKHRPESPWLIPQSDGSKLTANAINCRFQRFGRKVGHLVRPHDLRRSCATILSLHGMPEKLIQLALGHDDIKTTQSYNQVNMQHLVEWCDRHGHTLGKLEQATNAEAPEVVQPAIAGYMSY